jgi:Ca2+-binding EF-hand superfamily protein
VLRNCLLGFLISFIPASALAQAARAPQAQPIARAQFLTVMDQEFRKMDSDRDGKLTRIEAEAFQKLVALAEAGQRSRALFAQLDADRNGQISPAEFLKLTVPATVDVRPMFAQYDPNRDGVITLVEHRTVKLSRFDALDTDKDGIASPAEQRAAGLTK